MARSGVVYGSSNTYKTTAVKHFSHYIAKKTGKATLLLSTDGGGWAPCEPEVKAGMIQAYRCDTATIPLSILRKVSQGYWPSNPEQTDIGLVDFRMTDWNQIGGIAIEGLTSISTMLMRFLADKAIKTGEEATSKFQMPILVNGQVVMETFAGNSKGHYGFVQNQLYALVTNFQSLPVEYVLFTAHEAKSEDEDRTSIYGPAIAGKKATPLVPTWVGDCLHAQDYPIKRTIQTPNPAEPGRMMDVEIYDQVVRYYFRKHPDPITSISYPAKPRVTPEKLGELEKAYPGGYFEPTPDGGFDKYLELIDRLSEEQADTLKGWRERMDAKLGRKAVATK